MTPAAARAGTAVCVAAAARMPFPSERSARSATSRTSALRSGDRKGADLPHTQRPGSESSARSATSRTIRIGPSGRRSLCAVLSAAFLSHGVNAAVVFPREFAPHAGIVASPEQPFRGEICLNGLWQFQPLPLPENAPKPPPLTEPAGDAWEETPIRIPSPWNVNAFSPGAETAYRCFPSYPESWEQAQMGWIRRSFVVPKAWRGKRLLLRFEAVLGACEVRVNGERVAENFDAFLPFETDVTDSVRWDDENELLVGVRKPELFNVKGRRGHMPYPSGSFWGFRMVGIWQDVFLIAVPPTYISDVYVQPLVAEDRLAVNATVRNTTDRAIEIEVSATVRRWKSAAGADPLTAPEPRGRLDPDPVLELDPVTVTIPPHANEVVRVEGAVGGRLDLWTLDAPNLYGFTVHIGDRARPVDARYARFGWRQFGIDGTSLTLNGEPIQALGDSWHFMGIPQMTRRYAWAWFRMLKDANANAVRFHALPFPSFYYDVADEMGIMVLDETAIWASHLALNYDEETAWDRFRDHVRRWVLRDRNHPSVLGWSIANEILAALRVAGAPEDEVEAVGRRIGDLAGIVEEHDPTRPWISSDGDGDLYGRLPTMILHYGGFPTPEEAAELGKPWGVGETTGAYHSSPRETSAFNGDRSYESFEGRMEAVAIEAYETLARAQRPSAAFCSMFNIVWYGLKPLPLGLSGPSQAPTMDDGVLFPTFIDGKPGVQPERLGPYCTTLNPGYDSGLPLYETWPLFDAVKAAFAPGNPAPCPWDHRPETKPVEHPAPVAPTIESVRFAGPDDSLLRAILLRSGVPIGDNHDGAPLLLVDGASVDPSAAASLARSWKGTLANDGTVVVWNPTPDFVEKIRSLLPAPLAVTERRASSLGWDAPDPLLHGLTRADLYFSERNEAPFIMTSGLGGELVDRGRVVLEASNTEWRRWNRQGEDYKTGRIVRSEREAKPRGAAVVVWDQGPGRVMVCSLNSDTFTIQHLNLVRALMRNLGVRLGEPMKVGGDLFDATGTLHRALVIGAFRAADHDAALDGDWLDGETAARPQPGETAGGLAWTMAEARDDGVFDLSQIVPDGAGENCAAYLGFWLFAPSAVGEGSAANNGSPLSLRLGSDDGRRAWVNGTIVHEDRAIQALAPERLAAVPLVLDQGWNRILVKVAQGTGRWECMVRLECADPRLLQEIRSSLTPGDSAGAER